MKVGDKVYWRHRRDVNGKNVKGVIKKIDDGCNAVYWVDFGLEFLSPVCIQDIKKI